MNSRFNDDQRAPGNPAEDDASFGGLMAFDTVPPPAGHSPGDVHDARTTVAELPDSFLDSLKSGVRVDVSARRSRKSLADAPPTDREASDDADEITSTDLATTRRAHAFELPEPPTAPYMTRLVDAPPVAATAATLQRTSSASDMASAREAPPRLLDALERLDPPPSPQAPSLAPPTMPSMLLVDVHAIVEADVPRGMQRRPLGLRDLLFTLAAVLTVSAMALCMRMLLFRYLR